MRSGKASNLGKRLGRVADRLLLFAAAFAAIALIGAGVYAWYGVLHVTPRTEMYLALCLPLLPRTIDFILKRKMRRGMEEAP